MPFIAKFEQESDSIKENARVLLPISLGQKYHTGERFKALVEFAKPYNATILIADALHRHNLDDEKKALKLGEKFLEKNAGALKDSQLIDSVESWEKYKDDASILKVVRWKTWAQIKAKELVQADVLIEEACRMPSSLLVEKMRETAKLNCSVQTEESSINYQKEENKYLLCFEEFDYHIYPKSLNPSQSATYQLFKNQCKIPVHKSIKFENVSDVCDLQKIEQKKRHDKSLPVTLRLLTNHVAQILGSSEISTDHKMLFSTEIISIITAMQHEFATQQTITSLSINNGQLAQTVPSEKLSEPTISTHSLMSATSFFANPSNQSLTPDEMITNDNCTIK